MHVYFQMCFICVIKFCIITENLFQYTNKVTDLTHLFCKLNQLCLYFNDFNITLVLNLFRNKWFMMIALGGK